MIRNYVCTLLMQYVIRWLVLSLLGIIIIDELLSASDAGIGERKWRREHDSGRVVLAYDFSRLEESHTPQ